MTGRMKAIYLDGDVGYTRADICPNSSTCKIQKIKRIPHEKVKIKKLEFTRTQENLGGFPLAKDGSEHQKRKDCDGWKQSSIRTTLES